MEIISYLLGKKSGGTGDNSKKIYSTTYDWNTKEFGTIDKNLTADDLQNSAIKVEYDYTEGGKTNHIVNIMNIQFVATDSGYDYALLAVYSLDTYTLSEIAYVPSTGELSWNNS